MRDAVRPDTVVVERSVAAGPARVFLAWADERQRRAWDVPEDGWIVTEHEQDFRVGGAERRRFGPPGAPTYSTVGHYLHIKLDRLIVSTGVMHEHGVPITATLCTVELTSAGAASTLVRLIDQSVYFGSEVATERHGGWHRALSRLADHLARLG